MSKQKGQGEEKDDRSNFTARVVSLSSVSMQIFSDSARGGNMTNKVKHETLRWEKERQHVRRCEIVELLTEASGRNNLEKSFCVSFRLKRRKKFKTS